MYGSATNDGGAGMASALGVSFLDTAGNELPPGGGALSQLNCINTDHLDKRLQNTEVVVACDVSNTLCGIHGASHVYGPQKGASPEMAQMLDDALCHYAEVVRRDMGLMSSLAADSRRTCSRLVRFCGGTLRSGVELVFEAYGDMEERIAEADVILSGEGSVDGQSAQGKVVAGLAKKAQAYGKPLILAAGRIGNNLEPLYEVGVTSVFPIASSPMPLEAAIKSARLHLEQTGESLGRMFNALAEEKHPAG